MNKWVKFLLGMAVTVACLVWTFKGTNWDEFFGALKAANWVRLVVGYTAILTVIHFARTLRWGNLLSGIEHVPFKKLNEASAIGFMMLIILPFRLGEFARPFLIAQRSNIRRSAAMTSVVLERIIDGLIIAALLFVLMWFLPDDARGLPAIRTGAWMMLLVFGGGFLFLLLARWRHDFVVGVMRKTAGRIAPGPTEKIIGIVDGFVGALKQLPDAKNMTLFFVWTGVYWVANGFGMSYFANSFDCSNASGGSCLPLEMSLFQGYFLLCVTIVGMLIPAAPGSAGTAQFALKLGMSVFLSDAVVNSSGVAFANLLWLFQIVQQILFGLFFMVRSHASFSDIAGRLSEQKKEGEDE